MRVRLYRRTRLALLALICAGLVTFPQRPPNTPEATAPAAQVLGTLPMGFEANMGQTDSRVRFLSRGSGYTLFLTPAEAVLALRGPAARRSAEARDGRGPAPAVLRMKLVGAASEARVVGLEELPGKVNYFIGNDPKKWRTKLPSYARVMSRGIYDGVDLVYYGNQGQLEFDFVVAPGVDPRVIRLAFEGAQEVRVDGQGDLALRVPAGPDAVRLRRPVAYQEGPGGRSVIPSRYVLDGKNQVGFEVAAYDAGKPLIIDPVLSYSTFLGGSYGDQGRAVAVDLSGNVYVTGYTCSYNFPVTGGAFQAAYAGGCDAFVTKLNATGSALVYSTYLGGSLRDEGTGIALDSAGNVYVAGITSSANFPTTGGAFQTVPGGGTSYGVYDAFVTKLNAAGSALVYSTYLGGSGDEGGGSGDAPDIAVDSAGAAYVAGVTFSANFPTTGGAFQTALVGLSDAFVTKLNAAGSALVYSTYLGGSDRPVDACDCAAGIAVDAAGNAYVVGQTSSSDFPTTAGVFQPRLARGQILADAFVTKLNASGSALVYSTYLGGGGADGASDVALDSAGNAYVTGTTYASNFPTTRGAFDRSLAGIIDAFVTKLNAAGSGLVYSTLLGGNNTDYGHSIAVDSLGSAYVTGFAWSSDFPAVSAIQAAKSGIADAFVTKLNATGTALVYSTYLGGSDHDIGWGIAVDALGNAYVTGVSPSANFPTTVGAFQTVFGGDQDGFVVKIAP